MLQYLLSTRTWVLEKTTKNVVEYSTVQELCDAHFEHENELDAGARFLRDGQVHDGRVRLGRERREAGAADRLHEPFAQR